MVPALPHPRVFIVEFSSDADPGEGRLVGRIEHVDSGGNGRFTSAAAMVEVFARVLREAEELSGADASDSSERKH